MHLGFHNHATLNFLLVGFGFHTWSPRISQLPNTVETLTIDSPDERTILVTWLVCNLQTKNCFLKISRDKIHDLPINQGLF